VSRRERLRCVYKVSIYLYKVSTKCLQSVYIPPDDKCLQSVLSSGGIYRGVSG